MKKLSKEERRAWWSSLTAKQQADKRCEWLEEEGKIPNWDLEYTKVIEENNFLV